MKRLLWLTLTLGYSITLWADPHLGLPAVPVPADNPQTPEKIALGKRLFNDRRFSADGTISCGQCHQPAKAFSDGLPTAVGIRGQSGNRNTPSILNAAFYETWFVDGRAGSLEQQALGPLLNSIEHGLMNFDSLTAIVRKDSAYVRSFSQAFGVNTGAINIDHVTQAIAAYERTLIAGDSAFDRYLFASDKTALTDSAKRGLDLFQNKGHCVTCHEISWNQALFTDNRFYNIGVGFKRLKSVLTTLLKAVESGNPLNGLPLTAAQLSELGRFAVTRQIADLGKFKTPTLRNIALTAPYMHDGSLLTLEEVVEHYDKGGDGNDFIDKKIFSLQLTRQEKQDLVAFMNALTSATLANP